MKHFLIYPAALLLSFSSYGLEYQEGLKLLSSHPSLQSSKLDISIAHEDKDLMMGNILPTINFNANYIKQDSAGNAFVRDEQKTYSISLNQPLFRGLREFKVLDQAKMREEANKLLYEYAWMNQASNYTNQYFDLFTNLKTQDLTRELISASQDREKYLKDRVRIGRSRKSDYLTAQAQTLRAKRELSVLQNNERILRQSLAFNLSIATVTNPSETKDKETKVEFDVLLSELNSHPLLKARKLEIEIVRKEVGIAKGEHLPTLDLNGNYYLERQGAFAQNEWDLSLNLTFPIYNGSKTVAATDKASLQLRQAMFNLQTAQQDLRLLLKELTTNYSASLSQLRLAKEASVLDKKNYSEFKKEYELGLLTNLEVVTALNQSIESQIEVARLGAEVQKVHSLIKILTGEVSEVN